MGCFSFMCKVCEEPILSDSFKGQRVKLYLLKKGKVIDSMQGEYNSYGRVFVDEPFNNDLRKSVHWKLPWSNAIASTEELKTAPLTCCDLIFNSDIGSGVAAIHEKCLGEGIEITPTTQSADDPNQGWGEELELLGGEYDGT